MLLLSPTVQGAHRRSSSVTYHGRQVGCKAVTKARASEIKKMSCTSGTPISAEARNVRDEYGVTGARDRGCSHAV